MEIVVIPTRYPDLFVTITCNSNWREIQDFLKERNLKASDRPNIVCRVFKMKLDKLMDDFKKEELFGKVDASIHNNISSILFKYFIYFLSSFIMTPSLSA
jgi:hypothetical protein